MVRRTFSHIDQAHTGRNLGKDPLSHKAVIHNHLGIFQSFHAFQGKKSDISWACTHKPNLSLTACTVCLLSNCCHRCRSALLSQFFSKTNAQFLRLSPGPFQTALFICAGLLLIVEAGKHNPVPVHHRMGRNR